MTNALSNNPLINNALRGIAQTAPQGVISAIKTASARTGVNFAYLVQQAAAESSFNPKAQARTSSAAGLYQFIESTWLGMVKKYGAKHGLGEYADMIDDRGRVASKAARREILALRNDAGTASLLAAEFAGENKRYLEKKLGDDVGSTELYFAHFLGAGSAAAFLKAREETPLAPAADIFPDAARANRNVFYDTATGRARSFEEVYQFFDRKFSVDAPDTQVALAETGTGEQPELTTADTAEAVLASMTRSAMNALQEPQERASNTFTGGGWGRSGLIMSPVQVMLLSSLDMPILSSEKR